MRTFADLERAIGQLAAVPSRVAADAAGEIEQLIEQGFDAGVDPYGRPWAPLAASTLAKGRTPPPLTDTGSMRTTIAVRPQRGAGIAITMGVDYAVHHQYGTETMPARPVFPNAGLPDTWRRAIADAADRAFERAFQ